MCACVCVSVCVCVCECECECVIPHRANIEDEMCNFYMMYYTLNTATPISPDGCWSPAPSWLKYPVPAPFTPPTHHHHDDEEEDSASEEEEEEGEEEYVCPSPVPPGAPSDCGKPTTRRVVFGAWWGTYMYAVEPSLFRTPLG